MGSFCIACVVAVAALLSLLDFCLSMAEIVMGAKHMSDCPVQKMIPVYLVVAGCTGLVLSCINCLRARNMKNSEGHLLEQTEQKKVVLAFINFILASLSLFAFVWLICGMVWIFAASPTFDLSSPGNGKATIGPNPPTSSTYCYKPLYSFAMAAAVLRFIVLSAYVLSICCICCAAVVACANA